LLDIDGMLLEKIKIQDEELCKVSMKSDPNSFSFVINQTKELNELAIDLNVENLKYVKDKTKEICDYASKKSIDAFEHVPDNQINETILSQIIDSCSPDHIACEKKVFKLFNRVNNLSSEIVIKIIIKFNARLHYLDYHYSTNNHIVKHVFANNKNETGHVYFQQLSESDKLWVLERNGLVIRQIKDPTKEHMETAIKQNPMALQYISPKKQTIKLCKMAFSVNKNSIQYAMKQDKEMCEEAFEHNPSLIEFLKFQNTEMCEKSIQNNVETFQYLKYKSETIYEAYLKVHPEYVSQMSNISKELKKLVFGMDKKLIRYFEDQPIEMVNELLKEDPSQLKHMNFQTKEMAKECFSKDKNVFPFVIEKSNEMILEALEHNPFFLQFVENRTQEHMDVAIKKNSMCVAFFKN